MTDVHSFESVHAGPWTDVDRPRSRVYFWCRRSSTEAHAVSEVLRWVEERASGRLTEVFVESDDEVEGSFIEPRKSGLVRLLGRNRFRVCRSEWVGS